jgi:CHAT domain-containing protein
VAGAKSVVMSLFKVSDEVTQELMNLFYQNWIATGDKRQSFIDAKKAIKDKYKKPIYWGAFIMVGME